MIAKALKVGAVTLALLSIMPIAPAIAGEEANSRLGIS